MRRRRKNSSSVHYEVSWWGAGKVPKSDGLPGEGIRKCWEMLGVRQLARKIRRQLGRATIIEVTMVTRLDLDERF